MRVFVLNRAGERLFSFSAPPLAIRLARQGVVLTVAVDLDGDLSRLSDLNAAPPTEPEPFRVLHLRYRLARDRHGAIPHLVLVPAHAADAELLAELDTPPAGVTATAAREHRYQVGDRLSRSLLAAHHAYR